ncbi:hypothetical protein CRE_21909 [Caenorhabditis remanei]|uniref:Uncharacterized protein n=1 Tax=Caenorhabditis remanei TaxID=31234 RepID=E3MU99_CAERE|nr:hypothetical protein CRE_21909 [Caenorhabditis remanei]
MQGTSNVATIRIPRPPNPDNETCYPIETYRNGGMPYTRFGVRMKDAENAQIVFCDSYYEFKAMGREQSFSEMETRVHFYTVQDQKLRARVSSLTYDLTLQEAMEETIGMLLGGGDCAIDTMFFQDCPSLDLDSLGQIFVKNLYMEKSLLKQEWITKIKTVQHVNIRMFGTKFSDLFNHDLIVNAESIDLLSARTFNDCVLVIATKLDFPHRLTQLKGQQRRVLDYTGLNSQENCHNFRNNAESEQFKEECASVLMKIKGAQKFKISQEVVMFFSMNGGHTQWCATYSSTMNHVRLEKDIDEEENFKIFTRQEFTQVVVRSNATDFIRQTANRLTTRLASPFRKIGSFFNRVVGRVNRDGYEPLGNIFE